MPRARARARSNSWLFPVRISVALVALLPATRTAHFGGPFLFVRAVLCEEFVDACLSVVAACVCKGWRPGCAPGGAPTFFLRKKKVGKETAPRSLRPFASLRATCDARAWGGVAELAAFFELRSNIRDEPDHEVRVSFGTRTHPSPCASRRSQQGWGAGTKTAAASQLRLGSVRAARCRRVGRDRPGEPSAARQLGPSEAMARVEPAPTPF